MEIKISKNVIPNKANEPFDILQLKKALNQLGYYMPHKDTGIKAVADKETFDALKAFQKDYALKTTGELRPDDETVQAINKVLKETTGVYMWHTVKDKNVRKSHAELDGQIRDWKDSPDPGEDFNCRCWAEVPYDSIIKDADDKDIMAFIEGSEKRIRYMYLDTTGNVTVGIGFMLKNAEEAQKLPFIFDKKKSEESKDGQRPATTDEMQKAFDIVKKHPYGQIIEADEFEPKNTKNESKGLLPLYLADDFIDKKLRARLQQDIKQLRNKFPKFNEYPLNIQKALLDMNFNLGNNGFSKQKWPKFFESIKKQDWKKAAEESHRKDIGEGRNQEIYKLLNQ